MLGNTSIHRIQKSLLCFAVVKTNCHTDLLIQLLYLINAAVLAFASSFCRINTLLPVTVKGLVRVAHNHSVPGSILKRGL